MAVSVESRLRFLTTDLVDFVLGLPENFLLSNDGVSKHVFRRAVQDMIPRPIIERRDKIGFATPESRWLAENSDWVDSILACDTARHIQALSSGEMQREWQRFRADNRNFSFRFWRWINLIRWSEVRGVTFD